jgi:hypothetical protein
VVEAEFLFELLMRLLAHPARLDRRGERFQIGLTNPQNAKVVLGRIAAAKSCAPTK